MVPSRLSRRRAGREAPATGKAYAEAKRDLEQLQHFEQVLASKSPRKYGGEHSENHRGFG